MSNDGGPAIELLRGGIALISPEDESEVRKYRWRRTTGGYAVRNGPRNIGVPLILHRFIMGPPANKEVHHKNGNGLDNRRANLLIIARSDHRREHLGPLLEANKRKAKYPRTRECEWYGIVYVVHRDHRGVSRFCGKPCASKNNSRQRRCIKEKCRE
jgi:hypothetical protein